MTPAGSLYVNDLIASEEETGRTLADAIANNVRVAIPGIVQSFDPVAQTATVQPAIMERIRQPDLTLKWVQIPVLVDVPIVVPRAGGFSLTLPVQPGDECVLLFQDVCLDGWWSQGGTQNTQPDKRRHDLSDAVAILGVWSQPRVLADYNATAAELRTDDGATKLTVAPGQITLTAATFETVTSKGTNTW